MIPEEQLKFLQRIWRGSKGYVFLSHIPEGDARDKASRKREWTDTSFSLSNWDKILRHLEDHRRDELYFAPMVFNRRIRRSEYAARGNLLWADLDECDPEKIKEELKPSYAWETSPGRYAGLWQMVSSRPEATERGGENHKLSIALGADPSGWDTTQLLRVPGSANNKPGYPEGIRGRMLWKARGRLNWDVVDALPEIAVEDVKGGDLIDEQLLESIDPYAVYARIRNKLPSVVRQYMRLKDDSGLDRSDIAWQIERELADAGCTLLEMVAIIRPTPWNKFEGRRDELKRLTLECGKALAKKTTKQEPALERDDERKHTLTPFWNNNSYLNAKEPEWLYGEFIPRGGCGFIAGIPKSMKSWLALDLAICASLGIPYLGYDIDKPVNVLYLQQEDPSTLVKARHNTIASTKHKRWSLDVPQDELRAYPGALYVEVYTGFQANDAGWQVWLAESIRVNDISLIIMDTLATVAGGSDPDSGVVIKNEVLDPIKTIARDNDCTMCFVHHNTKSQGNDRAGQNMTGSGQIHAWADFGMYVKMKNDDNVITFDHETKYTGTTELSYKIEGLEEDPQRYDPVPWVSTRGRKKRTTPGEVTPEDLEGAKAPVSIRIRQFLRANPDATNDEVATSLAIGKRTVTRYRKG